MLLEMELLEKTQPKLLVITSSSLRDSKKNQMQAIRIMKSCVLGIQLLSLSLRVEGKILWIKAHEQIRTQLLLKQIC